MTVFEEKNMTDRRRHDKSKGLPAPGRTPVFQCTITVYDDFDPPDCHINACGSRWTQVQEALQVCIANLQGLLNVPGECLMNRAKERERRRVAARSFPERNEF